MRVETSILALAHEERSDIRSVLLCLELENSLLDVLARLSKPLNAIVPRLPGWKLNFFFFFVFRFDL